jgi:spermidine/putrescine ABC transporter ATP-binding subunit
MPEAPPAKALDIRALSKTFTLPGGRDVIAVHDFSLRIEPGEFVTFLGPSGCGKTTVLRMLAGLERSDAGEILVDGRSIQSLPPHRRRVGMVFQNYALFPHMSVFENVAYSLRVRKSPEARVRSDVPVALKAVGLETMAARLPGQLSGGQQQRVALARALVMQPDLLLFDEPLSNLDAKLRVQVRGELRRLQKRLGTTSIYVTHDQDEAMSLSDRIVVMNGGRVEQVGTPEEVYAHPASLFVADFVGQVNALQGRIVGRSESHVVVETLGRRISVANKECQADDVLVLVRPEAVRVIDISDSDKHAGVVEEVEYRGDRVEYRIRVGGLLLVAIEASLQPGRRVATGDRVGLEFAEQAIHLLPAEALAASPVEISPERRRS